MPDKIVMVTGGTRGIGYAVSRRFVEAGYHLVMVALNETRGHLVKKELSINSNSNVEFVVADVSNYKQVQAAINFIEEKYGGIDIAVNNAGIDGASFVPTHLYSEEIFDRVIDINLKGIWHCCKYQIINMLRFNKKGKIINVSSVAGLKASLTGGSAYTASKHGVIGITKALAKEYAETGIVVNAVCPGLVGTTEVLRLIREGKIDVKLAHPTKKVVEEKEVAELIFMLSTQNISSVTGAIIPIDGGVLA